MTGNTTASFRQGETVTYGSHGVGVVEGLCSEMVAGQEMSLYVLRLQSGQVIKVSTRSAHQNFIPVQKKPQMAAVIAVLCQNPKPRKRVWAHTERDFTSRLGKQDAADLAKMVRDLHARGEEVSFRVHELYRTCLCQLVGLLQVTDGGDVASILKTFEDATGLTFLIQDVVSTAFGARAKPPKHVTSHASEPVDRRSVVTQPTRDVIKSRPPQPVSRPSSPKPPSAALHNRRNHPQFPTP